MEHVPARYVAIHSIYFSSHLLFEQNRKVSDTISFGSHLHICTYAGVHAWSALPNEPPLYLLSISPVTIAAMLPSLYPLAEAGALS